MVNYGRIVGKVGDIGPPHPATWNNNAKEGPLK